MGIFSKNFQQGEKFPAFSFLRVEQGKRSEDG